MATQALKDLSIANAPKIASAPTPSTGTPTTPSKTATGVITPESMTTTPVINIPTPATPVQGTALAADLEVQAEDAFTQQQTAAKEAASTTKGSALDEYLKSLQSSQGLTGLTAQEYAAPGGVNAITPELNDINDKIRKEQLALRRATERIQKVGGGLEGGAAAEIGNLERESLAKQADLSVIQMAVQGRYDSAKEIADRAVSAKLEQQQIYNETLKFAYGEAKDLFTTAEQREFETLLGNRDRKIEEERTNAQSIYELGIQASADGAPTGVVERMLKAKTREEALALGGSYIGALDREAQRASIRASSASAALNELEYGLTVQAAAQAEQDAANGVISPDQAKIANDLNKDFEAQPIVKAYNEGLQRYIVLEDTLANGIEGIQDMQLVYDFMKAVDPTSVVREQEFENAAKTGTIFQGAYARFNGAVRTGGFLPEDVKQDFIRAARASFEAKNKQYYNVKNEYVKRVNNTAGISNGANYLTAYEGAAPLSQVDFGIAETLSGATPDELQDILNRSMQMGQSTTTN